MMPAGSQCANRMGTCVTKRLPVTASLVIAFTCFNQIDLQRLMDKRQQLLQK